MVNYAVMLTVKLLCENCLILEKPVHEGEVALYRRLVLLLLCIHPLLCVSVSKSVSE